MTPSGGRGPRRHTGCRCDRDRPADSGPLVDEDRRFGRARRSGQLHQLVTGIADRGRVLIERHQMCADGRGRLGRIDEHQPETDAPRFIRRPKALDGRQQAIGNRAIGAREDEHAGAHAAADVQRIGRPAAEIDAARTLRGHRRDSKKNRERHTRPQGAAHNEESIGLPDAPRSHLDWGTGRHRSAADGVARGRFDGPAPRAQPSAASAWSLHAPAARLDRARRLAAPPAGDSGQRPHRSARRVLARRRRTERLAWRSRRKLGARPLLSRRPPAAGVSARERRVDCQGEPIRRVDAHPPATERMAWTAVEHRLVAKHGDAEGPHAVPGGHRRPPRRACVDRYFHPPSRRGRSASAEGLGDLSMGRRARLNFSGCTTAPPIRSC